MKTKNDNVKDVEIEEVEDSNVDSNVEVKSEGPAIAAAKKSKITIIAASSVLVTVVIYFMFFKGSDDKPEKLVEVVAPKPVQVASPEGGKSVFEFEQPDKSKEDLELLQKPAAPEVPTLPVLPEGALQNNAPALPNQGQQQQAQQQPAQTTQELAQQLAPLNTNNFNLPQGNQTQTSSSLNKNVKANDDAKENKKDLNPRYAPIIVMSNPSQADPALGVGYSRNIVKLSDDPIDKLEQTKTTVKTTYISDRVHTIAQGKLFTAVLETAINTEIPGFVRAIISRDVYGESGKDVLIPRGSRLFGSYSSQINRGQGRVEINWSRLIRPDGVDLAIAFKASDQFGRSGVPGETDNKYGSIIANSMLTSILAVGGVAAAQKLLTNNQQTVTTNNPQQGTTTTTGSASNQALYDVSKTVIDTVGKIVNNTLDMQPVIRIPQGTRITVIVNSDINIPSMSSR